MDKILGWRTEYFEGEIMKVGVKRRSRSFIALDLIISGGALSESVTKGDAALFGRWR